MALSNEIILYHYSFSPYARRIVWYLNLRRIPYAECKQPPTMPRPDVKALGVSYRRIPLCAIGRDIYNDTRLILQKLETIFPPSADHPAISSTKPDEKAIERLLDFWIIDGGIFARASQLIPTSMPLLNDEKFTKDREQYTGRSWSKDAITANRPEAVTDMKSAFAFLETTILADGRNWVLKTDGPSLADIEAVWPFYWLATLKGALEPDHISPTHFPKVFAWIDRFAKVSSDAAKAQGKPRIIKGPDAMRQIGSSEYAEPIEGVDANDPTALKSGQVVEVWPTDTGFKNKDKGSLVTLTPTEVVIETKTEEGKVVRIHAPRHGFRVRAVAPESKL